MLADHLEWDIFVTYDQLPKVVLSLTSIDQKFHVKIQWAQNICMGELAPSLHLDHILHIPTYVILLTSYVLEKRFVISPFKTDWPFCILSILT